MGQGESLGTRSLSDGLRTQGYCNAKLQAGFTVEAFKDLKVSDLDALIATVDTATAKTQTSRFRVEQADVFALRRDLRYGMRSRKWLFSRGQQGRLNRSYAGWSAFLAENHDNQPLPAKLLTQDAQSLASRPFNGVVIA